jgi:hypothetical protein
VTDPKKPIPTWWPTHEGGNQDRYARSKKHEQRLAADLGGRRLPNSGGKLRSRWSKVGKVSNVSFEGPDSKPGFESITLDGDIGHRKFHIEHKRTERDSIGFKKEWWTKVKRGASGTKTIPAVVLTFEEAGKPPLDLAVIPYELFRSLARKKF